MTAPVDPDMSILEPATKDVTPVFAITTSPLLGLAVIPAPEAVTVSTTSIAFEVTNDAIVAFLLLLLSAVSDIKSRSAAKGVPFTGYVYIIAIYFLLF